MLPGKPLHNQPEDPLTDEERAAAANRFADGVSTAPMRAGADDYIDAEETSGIYLRALEHPVVSREDLTRAGYSDGEINNAMHLFEWRGLVQRFDDSSWRVLPPDVVVPSFAARLEEHARQLRASAPSLSRIYQRGEDNDETRPRSVVQLRGVEEIARAVQGAVASATSRVVTLRTDTPHTRRVITETSFRRPPPPVNAQGDPIRMQAVYDVALLEVPGFLELIEPRQAAGEEQRFMPGLPFSLTVSDTARAVVDTPGSNLEALGMLLTSGSAHSAAMRMFDFAWPLAAPWRSGQPVDSSAANPLQPPLPGRDSRILQLMASGATDSTISRQLGISQRTVERRIKAYMDSINAVTRFQAAVVAAKRGLV